MRVYTHEYMYHHSLFSQKCNIKLHEKSTKTTNQSEQKTSDNPTTGDNKIINREVYNRQKREVNEKLILRE